jgi:hypothetical protein
MSPIFCYHCLFLSLFLFLFLHAYHFLTNEVTPEAKDFYILGQIVLPHATLMTADTAAFVTAVLTVYAVHFIESVFCGTQACTAV